MFKVCVIIDISKIKFFSFSGNERVNPDAISGNLTATISDYLPQSAIIQICLEICAVINLIFVIATGGNLIKKISSFVRIS